MLVRPQVRYVALASALLALAGAASALGATDFAESFAASAGDEVVNQVSTSALTRHGFTPMPGRVRAIFDTAWRGMALSASNEMETGRSPRFGGASTD